MPLTPDIVRSIFEKQKDVVGMPQWAEAPNNLGWRRLSARISMDGLVYMDLRIHGQSNSYKSPQAMQLMFEVAGHTVARISFNPSGFHTNPRSSEIIAELRGMRHLPGNTRCYSILNCFRWPPGEKGVNVAHLPNSAVDTVEEAIAYFLTDLRISGFLPPPPFAPRLL